MEQNISRRRRSSSESEYEKNHRKKIRLSRRSQKKKPFSSRLVSWIALKKGSDPWITASTLLLMLIGTIMVISTNLGTTVGDSAGFIRAAGKQFIYISVGYLIMMVMSKMFNMTRFGVWRWFVFLLFFGLMMLVLLFGVEIYGSRAWLNIFGFSLQPSEFAKPLVIASCGFALKKARYHPRRKVSYFVLFKEPILFLGLTELFVLLQHDIGTMIIIFLIFVACTLVPNEKGEQFRNIRKVQNWIRILGIAGLIVVYGTVFATDIAEDVLSRIPGAYHISTRIRNMKNPYADIYNEGYQPANSLYSIGSAGLTGKGLGNSARKYGYLTQAESDYILAVTIEETGLIGLGAITLLYVILIGQIYRYALRSDRTDEKVILCGTATYLGIHFIINVGGVGGLIPMTGVPLIFISAGGTSIAAACAAVGMAQAVVASIRERERKGLLLPVEGQMAEQTAEKIR